MNPYSNCFIKWMKEYINIKLEYIGIIFFKIKLIYFRNLKDNAACSN
jgi:hypothetical protein